MAWIDNDYVLQLRAPLDDAQAKAVREIPGLRYIPQTRQGNSIVFAPLNAAWLLMQIAKDRGFSGALRAPPCPRPSIRPEGDAAVELLVDKLRDKELRPGVLDIMFPYQRAAAGRLVWTESGYVQHPPGCLAGDTRVIVNRGGKGRAFRLDDLYLKHNFGRSSHRQPIPWDLSIPTRTSALNETTGFLALGTIARVVESGVKVVHDVTTVEDERVKATLDHRFWTREGWRALADIRVGEEIALAHYPVAQPPKPKENSYYPETASMWAHPYAVRREWVRRDAKRNGQMERAAVVPTHRLVAEAHLSGVDLQTFIQRVKCGESAGLVFLDPKTHHVHHVDRDKRNYALSNLEVLDAAEHLRRHGNEHAWQHLAGRVRWARLGSKDPSGVEPTYDVQMEDPNHSFVANDFIVHNSGKTLTFLASAVAEPGPILITTPASVRNSWFRQIAQYTELDAHVIDPDVYARKGSEKLEGYMDRVARQGLRPVVVAGTEALTGQLDKLLRYPWTTWGCDEAHYFKASKRRKYLPPETEGERWIERAIHNLSWAGEQVSRAVVRRLLLSATPIPDRTRDAWSQLDLCEPGSWGKTSTCFDFRHCDAKPNIGYPGIDNKGISNDRELARRWSFTRDRVPYSVTHALLPPRRLVVTKLPAERQDRPSAAGAQAIRDAIRKGAGNLQEARQLESASRKRTYLIETALSVLLSGGKVIVTTGLVADRARMTEDFQRKIERLDPARLKGLDVFAFDGTSHSPGARAKMREAYMGVRGPGGAWIQRPHPGPALVIATTDVMLVGQDWQDTDHMLVGHIPWNHGEIWQLINRVTRPGQTRSVFIEIVSANGTADDHIVETVLDKTVVLDVLAPDLALAGLKTSMEGLDDPEAIYSAFDARMERRVAFNYEYDEGEDG